MAKENKNRIVVQKYGGTSIGSAERIKEVAKRIIRHRDRERNLRGGWLQHPQPGAHGPCVPLLRLPGADLGRQGLGRHCEDRVRQQSNIWNRC